MEDLHFLQLEILKKLLFSPELGFSDLRPFDYVENNQLTFHIDQLVRFGHIEKLEKRYKLTQSGKEFANKMDTDSAQMKRQGKISAINCCVRNLDSNDPEFLVFTRLKHPFFGTQGFPSGKVWFGEQIGEGAQRELKEETNLEGTPELFMINHYIVYDQVSGKLLEDKYFYFNRFIDPKGEMIVNNEGKFDWVKKSNLAKHFHNPIEPIERLLMIAERAADLNAALSYEEVTHKTTDF